MMKEIIIFTRSYEQTVKVTVDSSSRFEKYHANGFKIVFLYNEIVYIIFDDFPKLTLYCGIEEYQEFDELFATPPLNLKQELTELVWELLLKNMTKEALYKLLDHATDSGFQRGIQAAQIKMRDALGITSSK